jgi:hypothetical protein
MFLGSRAQPVHKADNLTAICELTVYTMWDPQHLMASYEDSFTLLPIHIHGRYNFILKPISKTYAHNFLCKPA